METLKTKVLNKKPTRNWQNLLETFSVKNIAEQIPGVVWEAWGKPDASKQRIDYVSPYVEKMLGYSVEEWLETPNFWLKIVHPEDKKRAAEEAAAIFEGKKNGVSQFRWLTKEGRSIWVEAHSSVILDSDGNPLGMRGVTLDISDKKRWEEETKKEHERLQFLAKANEILTSSLDYKKTLNSVASLAVENIADWCAIDMWDGKQVELVTVAHKDPKLIRWARKYREANPVNFDREQGLGNVLKTGKSELYSQISEEMIQASNLNTGQLEALKKLKLKSVMFVAIKVNNKVIGAISFLSSTDGLFFDEEDLLLAEGLARKAALAIENSRLHEEIKLSRDNLEIIFRGVADGITVQAPDGNLVFANDAAARIIGFKSAQECLETPPAKILERFELSDESGKPLPVTKLPGRIALKGKECPSAIVRFRIKATGEERVSSVKASPVFDEKGKVKFAVNIFRDITASKLAEDKLRASEERFRSVVQSAPDFIFTVDRQGRIQFMNRYAPGFSAEEVIGQSAFDYVSNEYKGIMKKAFARVFRTGLPQTYEVEALNFDGTTRWFRSNVGPIRDKSRIVGLTVVSTDITEQKKAQEELQEAHSDLEKKVFQRTVELQRTNESLKKEIQERLKIEAHLEEEKNKMDLIYNNTRDGLTLYDKNGVVVYINPSLKRLFGVKETIVGVPREEILSNREKYFAYKQERSDNSIETQKAVFERGHPVTNVMIKAYSDPIRYIEANYIPIKNKNHEILGMIGSFRDVTTLKSQAEKIAQQLIEAQREKNRWEAIFGNVEEGIYVMDKAQRIVSMNGACELMTGVSEKDAKGMFAHDVFKCHDSAGRYFPDFSPIDRVYKTKEPLPYDEHLHIDVDGKDRWVGVSNTPIFDENHEILQCVGVIRDITALKELEIAKSEFVSIASHELRTPLTIINGYLSLLLNGDLGDPSDVGSRVQQLNVIGKVYKETQRLTNLVEELLNVSRIEEGRLKLHLKKVSLEDLVREVAFELQPLAASEGITMSLDLDVAAGRKLALVDRDKMKQVLVNLIDNAIKYNRAKGKVLIRTKLVGDKVQITVEDNGFGIPTALQTKIFSKFQQVPGSYIKENKGTGLGLFIVKSLVEMHNGEVGVKSNPGSGSKFFFSLPIVAAQS